MTLRWHVLGVGAIGGLFARKLRSVGAEVILLSRDDHCNPIRNVCYNTEYEKTETIIFQQQKIDYREKIDHLLVTTKAHSVLRAVKSVGTRLHDKSLIVIMANGMGYHDDILQTFPQCKLAAGVTSAGCFRRAKDDFVHAGSGKTVLGWYSDHATTSYPPLWFRDWDAGGTDPHVHWSCDVQSVLLEKLLINCAINPLTAVHNVCNGQLLHASLVNDFHHTINEVAAILSICGHGQIAAKAHSLAVGVATATASNTSSMRADVNAGRRTEVEFILGYLLERLKPSTPNGSSLNTPLLDSLLFNIRQLDEGAAGIKVDQ